MSFQPLHSLRASVASSWWHAAKRHYLLVGTALLLTLGLAKSLTWSVATPPLYAYDECQHFLYAEQLYDERTLFVQTKPRVPTALLHLYKLLDVGSFGNCWPIPVTPDLPHQLRNLTADRGFVNDGTLVAQKKFSEFHPPLFYVLTGLVNILAGTANIITHIMCMRGVSILLGCITIVTAVKIGQILFKGNERAALLLGALVALHPECSYTCASITNMSLEITLVSITVLLVLQMLENGVKGRNLIWLGATVAAGCLTRLSYLSVIPAVLLAIFWARDRALEPHWWSVKPMLRAGKFISAIAAVAACWYQSLFQYVLLAAQSISDRSIKQQTSLELIRQNDWLLYFEKIFGTYWGTFGWGQLHFSRPLYAALALFSLLTLTGAVLCLIKACTKSPPGRNQTGQWTFILATIAGVFLFYEFLHFLFHGSQVGDFGMRGQYYLTDAVAEMSLIVLAWVYAAPKRAEGVIAACLAAGMLILNAFSVFSIIVPNFCSRDYLVQLERVCLFTMVDKPIVIVSVASFLLSAAALIIWLFCGFSSTTARAKITVNAREHRKIVAPQSN